MKIKYLCSKLELQLKKKFPKIPLAEVYYSKRRKYVHFAFEKEFLKNERKEEFLREIEKFYNLFLKKDFILIKPMRIIHTIKWKSDYIVFRKRQWSYRS